MRLRERGLVGLATDLLVIWEDASMRTQKYGLEGRYEYFIFEQTWGNTSGGFETIGGCAMTRQQTIVIVPRNSKERALVYFDGRFAYDVPVTDVFLEDLKKERIAGCSSKNKYEV